MIWLVFFTYGLVFAGIGFSFGVFSIGRKVSNDKLNRILNNQHYLIRKVGRIMATLDEVLAGVAELDTQEESLIVLLGNIKAQLDAILASETIPPAAQAKIDALFTAVEHNKAQVVEAINANTPAEPV
jgi:hypothetical protein